MEYRKFVLPAVIVTGGLIAGAYISDMFESMPSSDRAGSRKRFSPFYLAGAYADALHKSAARMAGGHRSAQPSYNADSNAPADLVGEVMQNWRTGNVRKLEELGKIRNTYGADAFADSVKMLVPNMPNIPPSSLTEAFALSLLQNAVSMADRQLRENPGAYDRNNPLHSLALAARSGGLKDSAGDHYGLLLIKPNGERVYRRITDGRYFTQESGRLRQLNESEIPYTDWGAVAWETRGYDPLTNSVPESSVPLNSSGMKWRSVPGGEIYGTQSDKLSAETHQKLQHDPFAQAAGQAAQTAGQAAQRANDAAVHAGRAINDFLKGSQQNKKRD